MRKLLAAVLLGGVSFPAAAAGSGVEPLPANTRAFANDVASRATADQRAWAAEVGRRRPLPTFDALKTEVRTRFATRQRISEAEIGRLAFLGVVSGFDSGVSDAAKINQKARVATPTPAPVHHAKASMAHAASETTAGAELAMINLQSLVSQRQTAVQVATQMLSAINNSERTVVGNIGR